MTTGPNDPQDNGPEQPPVDPASPPPGPQPEQPHGQSYDQLHSQPHSRTYGQPYGQAYGHPQEQQPYGQQPPPYQQPPYGYPVAPPNEKSATTSMVLGIVGLAGGFMCYLPLFCAPFAMVLGAKSKRRIRESNGQLGGYGQAQAGFVTGLIGTILLVLAVIALVVIVAIAIAGGFDDTGSSYDPGYGNAATFAGGLRG